MAVKNSDGTYSCNMCGRVWPSAVKADLCKQSHNVIYVPLTISEINYLLMAIHLGDMSLISMDVLNRLEKFKKAGMKL